MLAHRIFIAAALLLLAAPLHAQLRDAPASRRDTAVVTLPEVEVFTSILPSVGPAVGSGMPARVTVLPGTAIDAWEPRLLSDVLVSQAGISLYDDLGSPFKTTLVMRGFTASPVVGLPQGVSIFLDGMPINEPDARQVNFELLPLEHVRRVELLSGTASLLGPNSLGGAINLVTRLGEDEPEAELEISGGSFGAYSAEGSLGGQARGWSYYLGSGYQNERGWREETGAEQYNGFLNLGRFGLDRGFRLQAYAARSRAETAGSLPLSVYELRPRVNLTAGDFEDLRQLHVALSGYRRIGAGRGSFNLYAREHGAERFNVNQINDPDVRSFSENRSLGAGVDWRWTQTTTDAAGSLGLRFGASGMLSRTDVRIFAERIDPGQTTHVQSPISDGGVFGVADYTVGRLTFSGGLRLDAVHVPFRNRLDPARDTTSLFIEWNPRGGLSLDVGGGVSVYGSIGRSFRAPAVIELACADPDNPCPLPFALGDDPPLDPVTAVTYELGSRWLRGPASLGISLYRTNVRNDIFLFPYDEGDEPVGSTIDGYFANIEATRRQGIEFESRVTLGRSGSAYLNYAYSNATFQVDDIELFSIREEAGGGENEIEEGDRLPLIPDHTLRVGVDFTLPAGLQAGLAARYTGRRYLRGDEANEEDPLDAYLLTDLRLGYALGDWEIQGVVQNLFATRYAAFGTFNLHQAAGDVLERFLTPGQPRTFRLILRRGFAW